MVAHTFAAEKNTPKSRSRPTNHQNKQKRAKARPFGQAKNIHQSDCELQGDPKQTDIFEIAPIFLWATLCKKSN